MTKTPPKAKRTARSLFRAKHKKGIPYRRIEREGYTDHDKGIVIQPGVNHTTLSRLANSRGAWLPKSTEILTALGLIKPRKPRIVRRLEDLSTDELIDRRDQLARRLEQIDALIERTS